MNLPESVTRAPQDDDGFPIPAMWQGSSRWGSLAYVVREKWSTIWVEKEIERDAHNRMVAAKPKKAKAIDNEAKPKVTRFTTDYAIKWGRRQTQPNGRPWVLVDREHYDYRTKRHHDLEGGVDCIFDNGITRVGIQGAGQSERAVHWERFEKWGGADKAKRRGLTVIYMEFLRFNYEPTKIEYWARPEEIKI